MNYDQARSMISDGDLVFVRGSWSKPLQSLIMWFTNSEYSHVGICFWITINNKQRLMIIEAQGGTTRRILNLSFYQGHNMDLMKAPKPWIDYADDITSKIGLIPYGWLDAIYSGLREKIQKYIYLPPKNLDSGEICSEMIAKALKLPITELSPQGLFDELKKGGNDISIEIREK